MLPQAVLGAPPRGGRKHHKAAAAYTLDRLQRWQEGDRMGLWESRYQPPPRSRQQLSEEDRRELALAWGEKASTEKLVLHSCLKAFALSPPRQPKRWKPCTPAALLQEDPRCKTSL